MSVDYNFAESNVSVGANSSYIGGAVDVIDYEGIVILVEGGSNCSDVTFTVKGKLDETDSNYSFYTDYKNVDLTQFDDNRRILVPVDVLELNDLKIEIANNTGSQITLTYRVGKAK